MDNKSLIPISLEYKEWTTSKKEYLDWLCSDSATIGLIWDAIKFSQCEHIIGTSNFKNMWNHLHSIHVTQHQGINMHNYYQELYIKKWDEQVTMSKHIGFFLHLYCHINDSGQNLDNIYIVYMILLSLPWSGVWDVVKQDLLDKEMVLNLDIVTTELLLVPNYMKRKHNIEETEKKQKAKQLFLFAKSSFSSGTSSGFSKKRNQKRASLSPSQDLLIWAITPVVRRDIESLSIQRRGRARLGRPNLVVLLVMECFGH